MQTLIEQRAAERVTYIVDTMQAAQCDGKAINKHLKAVQKLTGSTPTQQTTTGPAFMREFGGGI